jgi:alanine racemase
LPPLPRTAWLEIDLDRLTGNVAVARAALPTGVRVEAVVKADAYGHGARPVAGWLERAGAVDGLCVATLDEGLDLRAAGVGLPILVLYPVPPDGAVEAAMAGLSLTVGDRVLLERTLRAVAGMAQAAPPLSVQVEVETGLGRAGITPGDLAAVTDAIRSARGVELAGLWSHLAAPEDAARSSAQAAIFDGAIEAISSDPRASVGDGPDGWARRPVGHLAATGGLLAASAPPYNSVRLGLGLYGVVPEGLTPAPAMRAAAAGLRPAMSLHARPVRVARLPAGHGVSYGPSFETDRPSLIATLPLGYGDGWPRALSNRAAALVRGQRVPLVGTVAMDAVMADVTDVPGDPVGIDDEFVLLGEQAGPNRAGTITPAELAQLRTTISWEVVTAMSRRLPRVYHAAAVPVGVRTLTEEVPWLPASSFGTEISATSRSTPS